MSKMLRRRRVSSVVVALLVVAVVAAGVVFWWVVVRDTRPRFVVDEVDDGLQVEWVSTTVSDGEFTGTYRLTNMTGEDVWLPTGSGAVPDSAGGYALGRVFLPLDDAKLWVTPPMISAFRLGAGESREFTFSYARPFGLILRYLEEPEETVNPSTVRLCVGYISGSDLHSDPDPSEDLELGVMRAFELQHVSCSESIDVE
ncbi:MULTISPECIES: hypothetical protein [unclassified Actinobaculum]|uniref:hypothetical protein n=1 Tax=unclassified Actinobaculum TaxID=2609299 RepID=UPI000D526756|nr:MULTISPECIES: hypothetical protein [unclassified Actinobaculum]AWE41754.1 hypothetical protein DDD63_02130 [Actinobaculum sp. 313]RTE50330.1 hypothetical protein EKN07_03780 [Actinobaculum sp. 352]